MTLDSALSSTAEKDMTHALESAVQDWLVTDPSLNMDVARGRAAAAYKRLVPAPAPTKASSLSMTQKKRRRPSKTRRDEVHAIAIARCSLMRTCLCVLCVAQQDIVDEPQTASQKVVNDAIGEFTKAVGGPLQVTRKVRQSHAMRHMRKIGA